MVDKVKKYVVGELKNIDPVDAVKRFILINFGLFIMALGLMFLLNPADFAVGGVMGFSMVLKVYFPSVNLGILMSYMNTVLIIVGFIFVGWEFGGYTIYCSYMLSAMVGVGEKYFATHGNPFDVVVHNDMMLTLIVGIIIQGIGMALVFYGNASTGGTDIVAKIINKYTRIEVGKALFLADLAIVIAACFAFSPRKGLYALLGILMNGLIIDKVIAGFETKVSVSIISRNPVAISDYIQNTIGRGVTYVRTVGGYTQKETKMINVILARKEYLQLDKHIKEVDPQAFMTMHYVHEVKGEGFTIFPTKNYEKVEVQ